MAVAAAVVAVVIELREFESLELGSVTGSHDTVFAFAETVAPQNKIVVVEATQGCIDQTAVVVDRKTFPFLVCNAFSCPDLSEACDGFKKQEKIEG